MGTPKDDVKDEVSSEKLQQKQDPDTVTNRSLSKEKGSFESMSAEVVPGEPHKRLSPDALAKASQGNQDESAHPMACQEVSGEVQQRKNVNEGTEKLEQKQDPITVTYRSESKEKRSFESISAEVGSDELHKRQRPGALVEASQSNRDESAHPTTCQELSGEVQPRKNVNEGIEKLQQKQDPDTVTNRSESKEKGSSESLSAEVVSGELHKRLNPDALAKSSQSNHDESAHPTMCQKVLDEVQPRKNVDEGIEKLQQKQDPVTVTNRSESKEKRSCESMSAEFVSDELHKRQSPSALLDASQSNRHESAHPMTCQEVLVEIQPRKSVDEGIDTSQSNQEDSSLSKVPENKLENLHQKKDLENEGGASESSRVSVLPMEEPYMKSCKSDSPVNDRNISLVPGKASDSSQHIQSQKMEVVFSQPDKEQVIYSIRPEKAVDKLQPRRNPDTSVLSFPSDQGSTPSRAPEKPSEDGYNWRKYGQKLVRGNEFIRSYYKCTYPNCLAKKQVERSHDGQITNIHYITKHEHPKLLNSPQISPELVAPLQMRRPDMPTGTPREAEGEKSILLGQTCQPIKPLESSLPLAVVSAGCSAKDAVQKPHKSGDEADNNGGPDSKRQKKEVPRSDGNLSIKSHSEQRHIVQTMSEVDIVNDGYRWRKYGQKLVKGNPNPRSYYRCSSAGCPAKKHVERASHDPKLVITAYEGQHVHDIPPSRSVTQNSAGPDSSNTTGISGESTSQSGENKHVGLDMVVRIGSN